MPWQEMSPMEQRTQFLTDHQHGVSRKTGGTWLARYAAEGAGGLVERSHALHVCPHRIADRVAALLLAARLAHPTWGPAKLVQHLAPRHQRVVVWPAIRARSSASFD